MSYVETVLGPIHPSELGVTLPHDHIQWGPSGWEYNPEWWYHYPKVFAKLLADLVELRDFGGKITEVDTSGIGLGRDINLYRMISKYSGVNIVAPTGFWCGNGVYNYFVDKDIDYMEALFLRELTEGIGDSGAKAGIIKIANSQKGFTKWEEYQYRAAARAAKRTGCAIITHGVHHVWKQVEIFNSEKLDLSRVIISHCADATAIDLERDKQLARLGAWVLYDQWGALPAWYWAEYGGPDETKADFVKAMIDAGYIDRLLLSADMNSFCLGWRRSSPYVGSSTMADFLRSAPKKLRRVGISEDVFWGKIMTDNPREVIPIQ